MEVLLNVETPNVEEQRRLRRQVAKRARRRAVDTSVGGRRYGTTSPTMLRARVTLRATTPVLKSLSSIGGRLVQGKSPQSMPIFGRGRCGIESRAGSAITCM